MMALPVVFLSFARSDGVLDDWSIGKHLTGHSPRKVQGRQCLCGLLDFQNPSLNSRPLLQYSITPTTPGSEGTLLAPFQGAPNKATSSGRGFFTKMMLSVYICENLRSNSLPFNFSEFVCYCLQYVNMLFSYLSIFFLPELGPFSTMPQNNTSG